MQQSLFYFLYAKHKILALQVSNKLHPAKTLSILRVPQALNRKLTAEITGGIALSLGAFFNFNLANPSQNGVQNMFLTLKNAERNSDIHGDALSTILTPPLTV